MARLKKIGGVYIPIRGDYTEFQADIAKVREIARAQGAAISNELHNALSSDQISRRIADLTKSVGTATRAAAAKQMEPVVKEIEALASVAGIAAGELEKLQKQMLKNAVSKELERSMATIQRQTGASVTEMAKLRVAVGDAEGAYKSLLQQFGIRPRSEIKAEIHSLGAAYRELQASGTASMADLRVAKEKLRAQLKTLGAEFHGLRKVSPAPPPAEVLALNEALKHLQVQGKLSAATMEQLRQKAIAFGAQKVTSDHLATIQRQTGASRLEMARLHLATGSLSGALGALGGTLRGTGAAVVAAGIGIGFAAKASWDAALRIERLNKAYASITGSSSAADAQLRRIYETSRSLGVEFFSAADGAKNLFAAAKGTTLEADVERIFESFSRASASLSLTQDDMRGVFVALGQMMSKGKVQAEELRGQLGERLPGAFQLAAKAMGVTTSELDKMLEQGQVLAEDLLPKMADLLTTQYKDGASEAQSATNKLATEWERFKASLMDTDAAVAGINKIANALKGVADAVGKRELERKMAAAGTVSEASLLEQFMSGDLYTPAQRRNFAAFGTADEEAIRHGFNAQTGARRAQREEDKYSRLQSDFNKGYTAFASDSEAVKIDKLNAAYKEAILNAHALRDAQVARGEDTKRIDEEISLMGQEYVNKLDAIGKKSDAAGKQAANAAYRTADALREVQQESMRLAGDEVGLARLDMEDKFAKWQKAIGGVTPEMVKLHAEMEKALNLGLTPNAYFNATKGLKDTIAGLQAELDALDVEGGKRINPAGYARGQVMSKFEKFKLGDEWKVASEEQRKQIASLYGGLGDAAALQASDEINRDFLEKASSTFKKRTDLERAALEEQMRMYEGHVQNKALLDEWYQRRLLETSKAGADGARLALLDYYDETQNAAKQWGSAVTNVAKGFEDAMVAACTKGKFEFSALADSIIADLARIAIQKSITGPLSKGLDGLLGSMFSSGGGLAVGSMNIDGGLGGWANGGVFNSPDLHSHLNKVVDTPTFFRFAKGGVFGEAGPEAIMPLTRTSGGALGVRAEGVGGVTVNVHNHSGAPVETRETQDARGGRNIDVIIGDAVAREVRRHGSGVDTAMRSRYGARPTLTRRG